MTTSIRTAFQELEKRIGVQALPLLKQLLRAGHVKTYCQDAERLGQMSEMHTDFWIDRTEDEFESIVKEGRTFFHDQDASDRPVVAEMIIDLKQDDIEELFQKAINLELSIDQRASDSLAQQQPRVGQRGRPPKYEREAMWAAVTCLIAEKKEVPRTRTEITEYIQEWYATHLLKKNEGEPSDKAIKAISQIVFDLHVLKKTPGSLFYHYRRTRPRKAKKT
jgi:hypothetical protein